MRLTRGGQTANSTGTTVASVSTTAIPGTILGISWSMGLGLAWLVCSVIYSACACLCLTLSTLCAHLQLFYHYCMFFSCVLCSQHSQQHNGEGGPPHGTRADHSRKRPRERRSADDRLAIHFALLACLVIVPPVASAPKIAWPRGPRGGVCDAIGVSAQTSPH